MKIILPTNQALGETDSHLEFLMSVGVTLQDVVNEVIEVFLDTCRCRCETMRADEIDFYSHILYGRTAYRVNETVPTPPNMSSEQFVYDVHQVLAEATEVFYEHLQPYMQQIVQHNGYDALIKLIASQRLGKDVILVDLDTIQQGLYGEQDSFGNSRVCQGPGYPF